MSDPIVTKVARRVSGPLKAVVGKLPTRLGSPLMRLLRTAYRFSQGTSIRRYDIWVKNFDTLSQADRDKIRTHISGFERKPPISVIMPVYETPEWALREAIDSIRRQLYPYWELCIADDASTAPHIAALLAEAAANVDAPANKRSYLSRVKLRPRPCNGRIRRLDGS
jgi:hypothetical protein